MAEYIIDIPEYVKHLCDEEEYLRQSVDIRTLAYAIKNATPLPKGHWISHGEHCKQLGVMPSGLGSYYWCSNCETGIESTQFHRVEYNYCPKCGADMRADTESEIE